MLLSDISVKRPVFASVLSLLLVAFGLLSFDRLSLREYPDIDPPIVSIDTTYPGASAHVIDTRITELIEDRIAGVEGIRTIESSSRDGRSRVTVEFSVDRDIDGAANDLRDRISGLLDNLPVEADPPEIEKADANDDVIVWLNLVSDRMNTLELTDYADRYLVDRFSALDGVSRARVGGGQFYSMRVWLDRQALAARGLTADDVETALRAENVELPAGTVESVDRQMTLRVERSFATANDFEKLVLAQGPDGYLVRLGDVARVERGPVEERSFFRGNGIPQVSIGIIKQAQSNTVAVAQASIALAHEINKGLPDGMEIKESFDSSVFVDQSIKEVWKTLGIAIVLVVATIYLFLGSIRVMLVPAVTVPVSVIATAILLYAFGFTLNLLTLLAMVLAIGLVVDDAIVVLENVSRRMGLGESPLVATYRGARQVGFAVIATTAVLVATFVPIAFLEGDLGRLFREFALTMASAVAFSSLVALSLSPMLASQLLKADHKPTRMARTVDGWFDRLKGFYRRYLERALNAPYVVVGLFFGVIILAVALFEILPSEYAPQEDRGAFFTFINGPEGATFDYMVEDVDAFEARVLPLVEQGDVKRVLIRMPGSFGATESFNTAFGIFVLEDWGDRRPAGAIMGDVAKAGSELPGLMVIPVMRQSFGGRTSQPVQFVIGGGTYEQLADWRDTLINAINEDNPGLEGIDSNYKETKPQLAIKIDRDRAGDLGVSIGNIGRTLETFMGSRRVTTYLDQGKEYDVILEGEPENLNTPSDISNIYVRSERSGELIPLSNLVTLEEFADSPELPRFNRVRAITLSASLADGYTLGEALTYLEGLAREVLPENVQIDYKGQSRDFQSSTGSLLFVFILGVVVVFLVLAAQFESFVHPFVIMFTVPLAMAGALLGLWLTGGSLNIYTQIGLIMLVGLAAKNGILIVEFINQLRDEGMAFKEAILEAASIRLRPIVMTAITTAAGAVPLLFASGAGAETRTAIGVVVFAGVLAATIFTVFVVPVAYELIARRTGSPGDVARRLEAEMDDTGTAPSDGSTQPAE